MNEWVPSFPMFLLPNKSTTANDQIYVDRGCGLGKLLVDQGFGSSLLFPSWAAAEIPTLFLVPSDSILSPLHKALSRKNGLGDHGSWWRNLSIWRLKNGTSVFIFQPWSLLPFRHLYACVSERERDSYPIKAQRRVMVVWVPRGVPPGKTQKKRKECSSEPRVSPFRPLSLKNPMKTSGWRWRRFTIDAIRHLKKLNVRNKCCSDAQHLHFRASLSFSLFTE